MKSGAVQKNAVFVNWHSILNMLLPWELCRSSIMIHLTEC